MAEDKEYSFISVTPDEDDDIVIEAGAVPTDAEQSTQEASSHLDQGAQEPSSYPEQSTQREDEESPAPAQANAYSMLTTEEDLRASVPFAGMQRAILVVFVLLLVVALLYWFVLRPAGIA